MTFNHAVIWIDHREAHVIHFDAQASETEVIKTRSTHAHHGAGAKGSGHAGGEPRFLQEVIDAAADAAEILVVGPGSAKLELLRHAERHRKEVAHKIVGVETVDHPTDRQLLAHARKAFVRIDQLNGRAVLPA